MYKQKKKRAVDPNAPPRPNLLSQAKELRGITATVDNTAQTLLRQADEIQALRTKNRNLEYRLDQLTNYLKGKK
jgi:hypothetical protein